MAADPDPTPMVLQNVSLADISANYRGICNGGFTHVMKAAAGPNNAINYLNAAQRCGLKVIMSFPATVNHSLGRVYPSKVPYWVRLVKNHPALFGYLTVKEPSWNRLSVTEIRSVYAAFHRADPTHPVVAIFGDIPHFNQVGNRWGTGMADILIVDWYPVETCRRRLLAERHALHHDRPQAFQRRSAPTVAAKTPGTPIWLMVQTHKNLSPRCHKKQGPTEALLRRQVREAFRYLGATGIAFHTWSNTQLSARPATQPDDHPLDADDRRPGARRDVPVGRHPRRARA